MRVWYHGTTSASAKKIMSEGVDLNAPRVRDPGDLGRGFYLTTDPKRAAVCGDVVLRVGVKASHMACIHSPYFLDGLQELTPTTSAERLFYDTAFQDGVLRTTTGTAAERESAAQQIRDAFVAAGYTGILSSSPSEMVIFDPAVVVAARVEGEPVNLVAAHHSIPDDVVYAPVKAGGTNVRCLDCGLDQESVWDEHGVHAHVWSYASDRRGHWIWVQATCNRCGRVEVFRDTGGDASGYARDPRDYDRKHETNHRLWSETS